MTEKSLLIINARTINDNKNSKEVMLYDWCTWDVEYNTMVQDVRAKLVSLATKEEENIRLFLCKEAVRFQLKQ